MHVTVIAPPGSQPGQKLPIQLPDGAMFTAIIPNGVKPGEEFQVPITTGTPINSATPLAGHEPVNYATNGGQPRRYKYYGLEHIQGDGPVEGQGLSCCMVFFGVAVFVMSLCLAMNVTYYFSSICYLCQRCCWWTTTCCVATSWITYTPLTADNLPFNNITGQSDEPNGNGQNDWWSLSVAVGCGVAGSLICICCVAPAAVRRGGPAPMIGCGNMIAFLCHVAMIVAMAVQLISAKEEQWVFNPFCSTGKNANGQWSSRCHTDNFVKLENTSVAAYWASDYYMGWYGNLVYFTFSLAIILAFLEFIFAIIVFCGDDEAGERYSGTRRSFSDDYGWGW